MKEALPSLREMFRMPAFKSAEMEREYWEWDDRTKLASRTFFLGIAILTVGAVSTLDRLVGDEIAYPLLTLRSLTCLALGFIFYLYTRPNRSPKSRDNLIFWFAVIVGASMITTTIVAPRPAADFYPLLISATMVFGGALVVPRFRTLARLCVLTNVIYWPTVPFSATSQHAIHANIFILSVTSLSVVIGAFNREKLERQQHLREAELTAARQSAIQSRDEALDASRAKSHLLANVSHELRTPMNAILGFSDIMKHEMFGPLGRPQYLDYAADIHDAGTLLQSSINDLLDVSRLEVGKMSWTDRWVPLSQMTARAITTCRRDAQAAGIHLREDLSDSAILVFCDPDRMAQILVNLLTNAIKFSTPGTSIELSCRSVVGETVISVKDQGCGIAGDDIERICEPFGQVDANSMTAKKGGLGLGLSIVKGLLEKFEGKISIESELGHGTTVSLTIPDERIARRPLPLMGKRKPERQLSLVTDALDERKSESIYNDRPVA